MQVSKTDAKNEAKVWSDSSSWYILKESITTTKPVIEKETVLFVKENDVRFLRNM